MRGPPTLCVRRSTVTETLFISDLHLDPERPAITALFLDLLAGRAAHADALYILGDLFEAWVGDDDDSDWLRPVVAGLRRLADAGIPVYLMHGNRDFLMGEAFAAASGCVQLPDPSVIDLHGQATLLMHGDTLCTDDTQYQAFRTQVRSVAWRQGILAKPLAERQAIAAQMRAQSRAENAGKAESIMDVNVAAVEQAMAEHGVSRLVHGHTHRPGVHELDLNGHAGQRIVLGDWYEAGSVLACDDNGCRLETLSLSSM